MPEPAFNHREAALAMALAHLECARKMIDLAWGKSVDERMANSKAMMRVADASNLAERAEQKVRKAMEYLASPTTTVGP